MDMLMECNDCKCATMQAQMARDVAFECEHATIVNFLDHITSEKVIRAIHGYLDKMQSSLLCSDQTTVRISRVTVCFASAGVSIYIPPCFVLRIA